MNKIKENDVEIWSWNKSDSDTWTHGAFNSREEAIEDCRVTKMSYRSKFVFTVKGYYKNDNPYNANFTEKSIGKNVFLSKEDVEKRIK